MTPAGLASRCYREVTLFGIFEDDIIAASRPLTPVRICHADFASCTSVVVAPRRRRPAPRQPRANQRALTRSFGGGECARCLPPTSDQYAPMPDLPALRVRRCKGLLCSQILPGALDSGNHKYVFILNPISLFILPQRPWRLIMASA